MIFLVHKNEAGNDVAPAVTQWQSVAFPRRRGKTGGQFCSRKTKEEQPLPHVLFRQTPLTDHRIPAALLTWLVPPSAWIRHARRAGHAAAAILSQSFVEPLAAAICNNGSISAAHPNSKFVHRTNLLTKFDMPTRIML